MRVRFRGTRAGESQAEQGIAPVSSQPGPGAATEGRRAWNLRPWKGKPAVIEIVDASSGGWGHLMVDELEEWRLP